MPQITCPQCRHSATLPEGYNLPRVQCTKCQAVFELAALVPKPAKELPPFIADEPPPPTTGELASAFDFHAATSAQPTGQFRRHTDRAEGRPAKRTVANYDGQFLRIRAEPCRRSKFKDNDWTLMLGPDVVRLTDGADELLAEFPRHELADRIRFPSYL